MVKQSKTSKQKNNPYKNLKTGAFTKQAKAQGMSVDKFATYVIKNYKDKNSKYNPTLTTYRRALFVKNLTWSQNRENLIIILYAERPDAKPIKTGTGDIFKFRAVKAKEKTHPAEKPVELHKHILKNIIGSDRDGGRVVLDTFMGTGSIGVACAELGCDYIGMELEHSYYEVAKKRIVNV